MGVRYSTWAFAGRRAPRAVVHDARAMASRDDSTSDAGLLTPLPVDLPPQSGSRPRRSTSVLVAGLRRSAPSRGPHRSRRGSTSRAARVVGLCSIPATSRCRSRSSSRTDRPHAHAFYYAPRNRTSWRPRGERPPLIVISHGGPTTARGRRWTCGCSSGPVAGFAVADVNYGGSSGYGRAYRERLNGQWGIVDVADMRQRRHDISSTEGKADVRIGSSFAAAVPAATRRWRR